MRISSVVPRAVLIGIVLSVLLCARGGRAEARQIFLRKSLHLAAGDTLSPQMLTAWIRTSTFLDTLHCDSLVVEGKMDFRRAAGRIVYPSLDFAGTAFTGEVSFTGLQVPGEIDFTDAVFMKPVDFSGSVFQENVRFRRARFRGMADFGGTEFEGFADFMGAQFQVLAFFLNARFHQFADFSEIQCMEAIFTGSVFQASVDFTEARFHGVADFTKATLRKAAFRAAQFFRAVRFWKVRFEKGAGFGGAEFQGEAGFYGSEFQGEAEFEGTMFRDKAEFRNAVFDSVSTFREARFFQGAEFENARFQGRAEFERAGFRGDAHFDGARFAEDAAWDEAGFFGKADFGSVRFLGNVDLGGVFRGVCNLSGADVAGRLDLRRILFAPAPGGGPTGIVLDHVRLKSLRGGWPQLRNRLLFSEAGPDSAVFQTWRTASAGAVLQAYALLCSQFKRSGQQEDLRACEADFRAMEGKLAYRDGHWGTYALNVLFRLSSGYGTRPFRPIGFGGAVVLVFALLFAHPEAIRHAGRTAPPPGPGNFVARVKGMGRRFGNALYFSAGTFLHTGSGGWTPTANALRVSGIRIPGVRFRGLALVEGALGWVFVAFLLMALVQVWILP